MIDFIVFVVARYLKSHLTKLRSTLIFSQFAVLHISLTFFQNDFDTLSEVSFASDNIHFQSKGHIRQLLQDHFKHRKKVGSSSQTLQVPQNYTRIPRSRSNTSSTFATSSRDSALGTEVDSDARNAIQVSTQAYTNIFLGCKKSNFENKIA